MKEINMSRTYEEVMSDLKDTFVDLPKKKLLEPVPKYKQIKPLEYAWLKKLYWDLEWTMDRIAKHLSVSAGWIGMEVKRLDLEKSKHGITFRGKKGIPMSDAQKITLQKQPHTKKVEMLSVTFESVMIFRSQKYAAKVMGVVPSHIRRAIREPMRTCGGFKWRYIK